MKSGLRRAFRNLGGPPVPMSTNYRGRGHVFDLGVGKGSREQQLRAYGMSGTVYSIVSLLQAAAAAPKWHLYRVPPVDSRVRYTTSDKGSDQRIEVVQHAALKVWNKPNFFHTGFEFREGSNQHEELTGETYWVCDIETMGFPCAMWYVRPDRLEPVPDPDDYLVGWFYNAPGGEQIPLTVDEVIQEKLPDPLDPFRGAGPVGSIMPNIQQQRYATEYQRNLFINGSDPGAIIQVPTRMQDKEFKEFVERWRETHQGIARAGRVGVLEAGATWVAPVGTNNKDMEYVNLRLANRDEIREAWRMHKSMLGTADDVNRANAQTAEEVFVGWQTKPRLERRKDTLNYKYLPKFYPKGAEIPVEFDYEDPSPDNREADNAELIAKATAAKTLIDAGYDPKDVLEVVGLPDMGVIEKAVQAPVAPPGWVPEQTPGGGSGGSGKPDTNTPPGQSGSKPAGKPSNDMAELLRHVLSNGYVPFEQIGDRR